MASMTPNHEIPANKVMPHKNAVIKHKPLPTELNTCMSQASMTSPKIPPAFAGKEKIVRGRYRSTKPQLLNTIKINPIDLKKNSLFLNRLPSSKVSFTPNQAAKTTSGGNK